MIQERWEVIPEFPSYQVSSFGRIYNTNQEIFMRISRTPFGHNKISLVSERTGQRSDRSVAKLVAEAFVEPYSSQCDSVIMLDGNRDNLHSDNLMWRPRWFAWQYARQLKKDHPIYFRNLAVRNVTTGQIYNNIIAAGMAEGLIFADIWKSTYTGDSLFPHGASFEVIERV